jgi:hypothetical protein
MGRAATFCVLPAPVDDCNGGPLIKFTSGSTIPTVTDVGAHLASSRPCVVLNVELAYISAPRCGLTTPWGRRWASGWPIVQWTGFPHPRRMAQGGCGGWRLQHRQGAHAKVPF